MQAIAKLQNPAFAQAMAPRLIDAQKQATSPEDATMIAQSLGALAAKLTDAQAQAAVDAVVTAIEKTNYSAATANFNDKVAAPILGDPLPALAQALQALSGRLPETGVDEPLRAARRLLGGEGDPRTEDGLAGAVAGLAARYRDDKAFLATIVEALKYPSAAGKPTETLMAAVRQRFPDTTEVKGSLDAAVPWFEKQLDADVVARPPQRP